MESKISITMYSSADKVKGQGVGSAYKEQVRLVDEGASDLFDVRINDWRHRSDIQHFHTVDPTFLLKIKDKRCVNVAYCHFLPDTLEGSVQLPKLAFKAFCKYVVEFYKSADRLVVVNPCFIEDLVSYGIDRDKIYYIPNFVSKEQFYIKPKDERSLIRQKFGFTDSDFIVFNAGQVQTRKGVLDFVDVAKKCPEYQFVWAGGFSFGPMTDGYDELKKLQKNPPENVHFLGIVPREEMVDLYNMANVLFMPSYNELFPMTILEAVNLQVPLVLRDLDLYKDILFKHYLKGNDNDTFAHLIQNLHDEPALYREAMENSKALSDFYSREHVLQMWREFYVDAYNEKKNG